MGWTESILGKTMLGLFLGFLIAGLILNVVSAHPIGIALVFLSGVFLGQLVEVQERVALQKELRIIPSAYLRARSDLLSARSCNDTAIQIPKKDKPA